MLSGPVLLHFALIIVSGLGADTQESLLRRSDVGAFGPASFRARLVLTEAKSRTAREIEVWRSGRDKTLVRFLEPKERGKFLLRLRDQLWLITPGTKKPVRLNSSYRLYGGVSLDTVLGLPLFDSYDVVRQSERADPGGTLVAFELRAREKDVQFQEVSYLVRRATERPVRADYRLRGGRLATTVEFLEWTESSPWYARRVVVRDGLRKGAVTEARVLRLEEMEVPDAIFDLKDHRARRSLDTPEKNSR